MTVLQNGSRLLLRVAMALAAAAAPAWAQKPPEPARAAALVPAELFFQPADVLDAKLAPSGRRLAVRAAVGGGRIGLFVWELDAAMKVHVAARFSDLDVQTFHWVGEDRLVFTTTDLAEGSGDQRWPGLVSVRFDGEQLRWLIERESRRLVATSGSAIAGVRPLSYNHVLLHVPTRPDDTVVVGVVRASGGELESIAPLRLNVVTGRSSLLSLNAPDRATQWLFDPAGEARVAITRKSGRRGVHWRGPGDETWRLLDESSDVVATPFNPILVDSKGTLYLTRGEPPEGYAALTRWDFAAGKPEAQSLVRTPGFDFIGTPVFGREGRLWGFHLTTDAATSVWLDDGVSRIQKAADEHLPGYVNRISTCELCDGPDAIALVRAWSDRDPGHLWLYRASAGGQATWQLISRVRSGIDPRQMARVAFERIRTRDGRDMPVWLTIPPGRKAGDGGPAVVLVHGGPWLRGGTWAWSAHEQFLASRGYLVVMPEFRGSRGYGYGHYAAGMAQWGRAMQDDVADAARWAISKGWADRACIAGASYGGYSALMGLVRDGDLFRCGAAWAAVADLQLLLKGSLWIQDDTSDEGRQHRLPVWIGDPDRDAEMLRSVSPVEQASRIKRPLLLAHGQSDLRVPIEHAQRLRKALRDAGSEPEWVVYANEGHSWSKPESHTDFARRLEAFLARHLK